MEANICDINHLDADVLLPPRKRLLAGLKKQYYDGNPHMPSNSSTSSEFDIRLNNFLRSYLNKPNLSHDEIVEASRSAAEAAVKAAEAARAAAEEKAVVAAKAMAAAKSALELVATVSEETASRDKYLKKNKMKRHVPVKIFYNKKQKLMNCRSDEELARNLHRVINSSPRISKNSSSSGLKSHKHKRLKSLSSSDKIKVSNGIIAQEEDHPSAGNGIGKTGELDSEGSTQEVYAVTVNEKTPKLDKAIQLMMENGDAVTNHCKEKMRESSEDTCKIGRKRGRIKQKKLPLSICNFRDLSYPKEEQSIKSLSMTEGNMSRDTVGNKPLFSQGPSSSSVMPIEKTSMWKCKVFKAPACVKQNKVKQS